VPRILGSTTHYEVLQLVQGNTAVFVDAMRVRRRYKELAILVHPDKNRSPGASPMVGKAQPKKYMYLTCCFGADAETAFKRLSEAYECLADELSQRNYLLTLQPKARARSAHLPKFKRKRKTRPEAKTQDEAEPPKRRRRTPEEIWQAFQREEEDLARRQFMAKGFDRTYESTAKSASGGTVACEKSASSPAVPLDEQQDVLDSDLDAKAKQWAAWSKPPSEQTGKEAVDVDPARAGDVPASLICCALCRRKFPTVEALERHETLSKLHLANVQARRAEQSGEGP